MLLGSGFLPQLDLFQLFFQLFLFCIEFKHRLVEILANWLAGRLLLLESRWQTARNDVTVSCSRSRESGARRRAPVSRFPIARAN